MNRLAIAMTVLAFTGAASCSEAATNLLLGTWKLDQATHPSSYCAEPVTFAAKTYTSPGANGGTNTISVTYVVGDTKTFPTVVYLMTDAGITAHVTYRFLSANRMIMDTALQCTYVK